MVLVSTGHTGCVTPSSLSHTVGSDLDFLGTSKGGGVFVWVNLESEIPSTRGTEGR